MYRALRGALVTTAVITAVAAPSAQAADTRPPTTPTNVRLGEVTPTTVELFYNESTDDVRVNGYARDWITGRRSRAPAEDDFGVTVTSSSVRPPIGSNAPDR